MSVSLKLSVIADYFTGCRRKRRSPHTQMCIQMNRKNIKAVPLHAMEALGERGV
jgi:hypothetical protein